MNISSHIVVAPIGDRAVLLDVQRNRYSALAGSSAHAVVWAWQGCLPDRPRPSEAILAKLLDQGLLTMDGRREPVALPSAATSSLYPSLRYDHTMVQPQGIGGTLAALQACVRAQRVVTRGSMERLLDWLRRTQWKRRKVGDFPTAVDAYYAARPFFPVKPICRLDAAALRLFLRRRGFAAEFVLGVRLDPFIAHSWVQVGDVTVGEAHDRIRQFTPMLAV